MYISDRIKHLSVCLLRLKDKMTSRHFCMLVVLMLPELGP